MVAVLVREVTRSPGSHQWPVQVQGSPDTGNHGSGHWILDILNITPCEAVVWTAVQECLAPLQPPVLHSLLLEAGSDKATHHGYTNLSMQTVYTLHHVQVQQILRAAAGAPRPGPGQAAGDRGGGRPQPRSLETVLPSGHGSCWWNVRMRYDDPCPRLSTSGVWGWMPRPGRGPVGVWSGGRGAWRPVVVTPPRPAP